MFATPRTAILPALLLILGLLPQGSLASPGNLPGWVACQAAMQLVCQQDPTHADSCLATGTSTCNLLLEEAPAPDPAATPTPLPLPTPPSGPGGLLAATPGPGPKPAPKPLGVPGLKPLPVPPVPPVAPLVLKP